MSKKAKQPSRKTENAAVIAQTASGLAEWAQRALSTAELLRFKDKPVGRLGLKDDGWAVLGALSAVAPSLREKLASQNADFTFEEATSLMTAAVESMSSAERSRQKELFLVVECLADRLANRIAESAKRSRKRKSKSDQVFQFKITLIGTKPPIWRRIQVKDGMLDKLHEHIQTAMGWTNSHLHQFQINGERYSDPELWDDEFELIDSTATKISEIVPQDGSRFRFRYEYDFGDGWEHEILFEGCVRAEPKSRYPLCLEGARACPPEDVGGIGGYEEYVRSTG